MGRGRAKAKQTKVARQLKYHSPTMDLESLQRELAKQSHTETNFVDSAPSGYEDYEDDPYAAYAEKYNREDCEDDTGSSRSADTF